ncbi:MAG: hypothetical protein LBD42_01560 [Desulfovibrio sp.]|jgi:hypothetical protein|nr:hypothetical protein [Desulfovibrio sp.]
MLHWREACATVPLDRQEKPDCRSIASGITVGEKQHEYHHSPDPGHQNGIRHAQARENHSGRESRHDGQGCRFRPGAASTTSIPVDGRGVVIFTLSSGGSIRDSSKELFYSVHDEKAHGVALAYAALKWGKNIAPEQGRIVFQQAEIRGKRNRAKERGWTL